MSRSALAAGLRQLRGKLAVQQHRDDSDEQLLHAFLSRGDDSAFAALVQRHGPMVLHVCRRVLGHEQDAEDAFQATFLVLAQRAASLRNKASLAGFLHGTAYRTAMKAKRTAGRRRKHEGSLGALRQPRSPAHPVDELSWREVRALLDEEIARLPEKFRVVFVLFHLEHLSREQTARRLGLKDVTVAKQLAEARKRLGRRLARRGVELTAVLAASTLAAAPAPALMATTIQTALATAAGEGLAGVASEAVAELVQSATTAMMVSKGKLATVLLLTASLLAGASAWTCRILATPQPAEPQVQSAKSPFAAAKDRQTPHGDESTEAMVSGRVVDPDGKPVQGARLYVPFMREMRGMSDTDGRFRVRVPRSTPRHRWTDLLTKWNPSLVARADGYGLAWADVPTQGAPGELTLRLVKDQPIRGRIVNTEGKPLSGVRVRVVELISLGRQRLDAFLSGWKHSYNNAYYLARERGSLAVDESFLSTTTDGDGRFELRGVGQERLVLLQANGGGIAQGLLYVVTRPGFDPAPINKAVADKTPQRYRGRNHPPLLHGSTILYVTDLGRAIEGVIREAGSGKPVPGMTVAALADNIDYAYALADAQGRFRLEGLDKRPQYWLQTPPGGVGPWMGTAAIVPDDAGLRTLKVELTVARGVVVTGRVIDRATGRGVPSHVRSAPLPENKYCQKPGYDLYRYPSQNTPTDADGRFRLVVVPGPSVLLVQASAVDRLGDGTLVNAFTQPQFSDTDRKRVTIDVNQSGNQLLKTAYDKQEYLPHNHACIVLDPAEDACPIHRDVFVERGRTLTVHLDDAEGKPLTGCLAGGLTDQVWPTFTLKEASCTVYALRTNKPRPLAFLHPQRGLAGLVTLRGDEKEALTVRMMPTGTMKGRVLDAEGQPLAGVIVRTHKLDNEAAQYVDFHRNLQTEPILTGADGRFRIDDVIPHVKHHFMFTKGKTHLVIDSHFELPAVQSAQTLDLGDIRTKPGE